MPITLLCHNNRDNTLSLLTNSKMFLVMKYTFSSFYMLRDYTAKNMTHRKSNIIFSIYFLNVNADKYHEHKVGEGTVDPITNVV